MAKGVHKSNSLMLVLIYGVTARTPPVLFILCFVLCFFCFVFCFLFFVFCFFFLFFVFLFFCFFFVFSSDAYHKRGDGTWRCRLKSFAHGYQLGTPMGITTVYTK